MQSKATRGVRRLLVSTGVVSLVLSAAAPAALAGQADNKVWVCHATGSLDNNPWVLVHVSENAGGHDGHAGDAEISEDALFAAVGEPLAGALAARPQATLQSLSDEQLTVVMDACRTAAAALPPATGTPPVVTPPQGGGSPVVTPPQGGGSPVVTPPTGGGSPVVTPPEGGAPGSSDGTPGGGNDANPTDQDNKGQDGAEVDGDTATNDDETKVPPAPQPKPIVIISTDTVTAPAAPVIPAVPAAPATPAAPTVLPTAPATPAVPATPASPAATPDRTQTATSSDRGPQVLGSVTTRTPGGAQVTSLAATGVDSTTFLVVIGMVLLLSGAGLELLGRTRETAQA